MSIQVYDKTPFSPRFPVTSTKVIYLSAWLIMYGGKVPTSRGCCGLSACYNLAEDSSASHLFIYKMTRTKPLVDKQVVWLGGVKRWRYTLIILMTRFKSHGCRSIQTLVFVLWCPWARPFTPECSLDAGWLHPEDVTSHIRRLCVFLSYIIGMKLKLSQAAHRKPPHIKCVIEKW